jgi:hypothetical protein
MGGSDSRNEYADHEPQERKLRKRQHHEGTKSTKERKKESSVSELRALRGFVVTYNSAFRQKPVLGNSDCHPTFI